MHITLPDELGQKLAARVKNSEEFSSIDAYVCYVLEEVLKQTAETAGPYTKDQEAEVKERLENLGYLD